MTASLLASTIAVALTPAGPIKDGMLALALCLSVAAGAKRGASAAKASARAALPSFSSAASSSTSSSSSSSSECGRHGAGAAAGLATSTTSPAPPLGPVSVAAATTLSLVLVAILVWWDPSDAPRVYIIVAGGAAFFATFRPVLSRCVPASAAQSSIMSSILCSLVTLSLMAVLQFWPEYVCGLSIVYVCFVSQVVQAVPLDSVAVAVVLNVASMAVELVVSVGVLPFGGGGGGGGGGVVGGAAETIIWKSLKDLAIVGTLFPALLAFDAGSSNGYRRYFYAALAALFCCLLAIGVGGLRVPLCYLSTPFVLGALSVQAFARGELSALFGYRISSSMNVKKK
jgi:hypothetical protein